MKNLVITISVVAVCNANIIVKRALPEYEFGAADRLLIEEDLNENPFEHLPGQEVVLEPNRFNYEVSLGKYLDRYYYKEQNRIDRKKLRNVRMKHDMLLRNSASELMAQSWKHGRVADDLFTAIGTLQAKERTANDKAEAYKRLGEKLHNGDSVSDSVAKSLYYAALSRAKSSLQEGPQLDASTATFAEQFEDILSDQTLLADVEENASSSTFRKMAKIGKDSRKQARILQFKAALLSNARHCYFDLVKSRRKANRLGKTNRDVLSHQDSEKIQFELDKLALKEKAVAQSNPMAAYELSNLYKSSARRHEAAVAEKWNRYELASVKRDAWRAKAIRGIRHLPSQPSSDQQETSYFTDDDSAGSESDDDERQDD